jgi:hypothetical protein
MPSVTINIGKEAVEFILETSGDRGRWIAPKTVPEGCFPLVVEIGDRRFELYSDGTLALEGLKDAPPPDARVTQ